MLKNDLHTLIHSMSMSEKRHFKLFAKRYGNETNQDYLVLFDAIASQKSYDQESIEKSGIVKNISVEKNYLYSTILKSLTSYHSHQTTKKKLLEIISGAEVLFQKGLNRQALEQLAKAEVLARDSELFAYLLVIQELTAEVHSKNFDYANATEVLDETQNTITELKNLVHIQRHTTAAYRDHIQHGNARNQNQKNKLLQHIKSRRESGIKAQSARAELFDMGLELTYAYFISDSKEQMRLTHKMTSHYESHPHLIEYSRIGYISSLHNLINTYREHRNYSKAEEILNRMKSLQKDERFRISPFILSRIFTYYWNLNFDLLEEKQEIAKAKLSISEAESGIKEFERFIPKPQLYELILHLAKISFITGKTKECIKYTLIIMNDSEFKDRQDIINVARMLNIIAQFESGNLSTSEYLAQYTRKYLFKKDNLFLLEDLLLKYIIHFGGKTKKSMSDTDMMKELKLLRNDPYEQQPFKLFPFDDWMESRMQGRTMEQYYQILSRKKR